MRYANAILWEDIVMAAKIYSLCLQAIVSCDTETDQIRRTSSTS